MRAIISLIVTGLAVASSTAAAQTAQTLGPTGGARMAYFSLQRAFNDSADGKAARTRLSTLEADKTREIQSRAAKLQTEREALERTSTVLDSAARQAREQAIERFELDLQRFTQDAQSEFLGVRKAVEAAFLERLRPAVDRVAKDKQLLLVFEVDAGPLFWGDPSLDITSDIVSTLNKP